MANSSLPLQNTLENVTPLFFHLTHGCILLYYWISHSPNAEVPHLKVRREASHASPGQILINAPHKVPIYITFLPYLTLHLYLTFPYLTSPNLTIPYLNLRLTYILPYITPPYLTLPYHLPCHTLPKLTSYHTLPYPTLKCHTLLYIPSYLTLCITLPYIT